MYMLTILYNIINHIYMLLTIINHVTTVYMTIFMFFYSKKTMVKSPISRCPPRISQAAWNLGEIYGTSMGHLWEIYGKSMGNGWFNHI